MVQWVEHVPLPVVDWLRFLVRSYQKLQK